jgi:hypothetical protein
MSLARFHRNRGPARSTPTALERLEPRQLFSAAIAGDLLHHDTAAPAAILAPAKATPSAGGTGISAEYFADSALTTGVMTRTDASISFKGASGTAASLKTAGGAQWTGSIAVTTTSTYTFSIQGSGGVKLWVNGIQLINTPAITGGATRSPTPISLVAGTKYDFTMQYTKTPGAAANVKLLWAPLKGKAVVVPQTSLFPSATPPTLPATSAGLIGQYFVGTHFTNLAFTRVDAGINFNWGSKSPDSSIPAHTPFSILWTGQLTPSETGNYTFTTTADDGVRVYVGGQLVIDDFVQQSSHTVSGQIALTAGQAYNLKVEYFQNGKGVGDVKLQYALPGGKLTALPSTLLSSTPAASAGTLTAVAAAADEVDLTWTGSSAATGYTIMESPDGGVTWVTAGTTGPGVTTYDDTGLTANSPYQFQVTPFGSSDTSTPSNIVTVTTLTPPPGAVTATVASSTEIDLNWADVDGETGFDILESVNGRGYALLGAVPAGTTTLQVTGLIPGNGYGFEVESLNTDGTPSVPAVTTGTSATPTGAPAGLVAVGTSTSTVSLAWTDVLGDGGFQVERSTDGVTWTVAGTTAADVTTYTDTGLAAGVTYSYRVRGLSAADVTVISDPSTVASTPTVPAAPAAVNATAFSSTLVNLTWADVTGEVGFNVFDSVDGGTTFVPAGHVGAGVTTLAISPLLPATNYSFAVQAINSAGQGSALSANHTASATTTLCLPPTALVAVGTSATTAQLTWVGSLGATGYLIERSADGGTTWTSVATPAATDVTYVDTGLTAGVSYTYRIRATDAGGASDPSAVSVALTAPAVVTAALTGVSQALSSVSFPAVAGATSYAVQRSLDGVTGWTTVSTVNASGVATPSSMVAGPATSVAPGTTLSATVPNLAPSTVYYYRVVASNATGSSAPSAVVSQMSAPLAQYAADSNIYGLTSGANLFSLNMTAGTSTLIGQFKPGAYVANRNPSNGLIYYFVNQTTSPNVYSWDPTTGNNTFAATDSFAGVPTRSAYDQNSVVWITDSTGMLYNIRLSPHTINPIAQMTLAGVPFTGANGGNMVFSPTGSLYLLNNGNLYTVNTTTGALTPVVTILSSASNIVFGPNGLMYLTTPTGQEYSLNLSTLTSTLLSNPAIPTFASLTATPEFVDLGVTATATPTTLVTGHTAAYAVNVTNLGPATADAGTTVTVTLGNGLTYASVAGSGWTAAASSSGATIVLTYSGLQAANATIPTVTLTVNVTSSATLTAITTFTVAGDQFDTGVTNNTAVVTSVVTA